MSPSRYIWFFVVAMIALAKYAHADSSFDLDGPQIHVNITRGATTLPISEVPSLQPADQIWLRPEVTTGQSIHFVLVVAFLRGSTNLPPEKWFTKAELWKKSVGSDGIRVTVPEDAEQALLFFAPDTGGGFSTIRSAVESEPGVFVRAAVDLNQATLDRSRVEAYLKAVQTIAKTDPDRLEARSKLLARSLDLKIDMDCFNLPNEQQATCLTKNSNDLVLDDGHTQSVVAALTTGTTSDLFNQISNTSMSGGGMYSPYVGAIVDAVHLMGTMHTADYQYIPALSLESKDLISLKLNRPPSFHKPKSVLVMGLPAIRSAIFPPLRDVDAKQVYCLQSPKLVLPIEGAPLVFSSDYAHDMTVQIANVSGGFTEFSAHPDAERGGYVVDTSTEKNTKLPENGVIGKLRGSWGFDAFDGPEFHLQRSHSTQWIPVFLSKSALVVGNENTFSLQSDATSCVEQVIMSDAQKNALPLTWKRLPTGNLQVKVSMESAVPGPISIMVQQFGMNVMDRTQVHAYSEAATLKSFIFHSGDSYAVLHGIKLKQVASADLDGIHWVPSTLTQQDGSDALELVIQQPDGKMSTKNATQDAGKISSLQQGESCILHVTLNDKRVLDLPTIIQAPRPQVELLGKAVQVAPLSAQPDVLSEITFENQDDLPQNGQLSLFLKSVIPPLFPRTESIEVASVDGFFHTLLTLTNGTLMLQDAQTVFAELDPAKSFGSSAFGALQFRPVDVDGLVGDWHPLASLVRVPTHLQVHCPVSSDKPCTLTGEELFLLDSVASDAQFQHSVSVPLGFSGASLTVPRPVGAMLYIKLRDDPKAINIVALPVLPELE